MKCERCKKDYCFWTELFKYTFRIIGYKGKRYEIVRTVCPKCKEFYHSLECDY